MNKKYVINTAITNGDYGKKVRVVKNDNSEMNGLVTLSKAMNYAKEHDKVVIQIAENAVAPVVVIEVYDKFLYQEKRKAKENKSVVKKMKVVKLTIDTTENDLVYRVINIKNWLDKNHQIKIELTVGGRRKWALINRQGNFQVIKDMAELKMLGLVQNCFDEADSMKIIQPFKWNKNYYSVLFKKK